MKHLAHLSTLVGCLTCGCGLLDPEPSPEHFRRTWTRIGAETGRRSDAPATTVPTGAGIAPPPANITPMGKEWLPIDLPSALQLAGENNLVVRAATEAVAEAAGAELASLVRFLPTLLPGFVYNAHDGTSLRTEGNFVRAERNSQRLYNRSVLLLNPSRVLFEALQARRLRRAGEFAAESVRNEIGAVAAQQYFDMVRAQRQVGIADEFLRQTVELVRINQERVDRGVGLRVDLTRAEARSAEARGFLEETTTGFRIAGIRLAATLQLPADATLYPADPAASPLEFVPADAALKDLQDAALEANPTLREQAMLVEAAEKATAAAVWEVFIPRLSAEANNGILGRSLGTAATSNDYTVGLNWEFEGLGLGNYARQKALRARQRVTELRAEDVRRRLLALVAESWQEVQLQRTLIETASRQVRAAEESFRLAENRLRGGTGLFLDVLDAQNQLTRARVAQVSAVIEFNKAQYRLFFRMGNRPLSAPPTPQ